MAKQKGREMILAIWDGVSAYSPIAGVTAKTIGINNNLIDVTTPNVASPGGKLWSESMEGITSLSISGELVFEDDAAFGLLHTKAIAATPSEQFEVDVANFGVYVGTFFVESLELSGGMEGAITASVSLKSSGAVTFTPAV